jgi:ligand-binding sensor domain-containing protein
VDFTKNSNSLYAITENAAFIYNQESKEVRKVSSVDGLSGENTSAIYFDADSQSLVIGYETGLIEIVDENGRIRKIIDITVSEIATKKSINQIIAYQGQLIIALDFGIVSYSLEKFEFGDTYFIGANSTAVKVNDILILMRKFMQLRTMEYISLNFLIT